MEWPGGRPKMFVDLTPCSIHKDVERFWFQNDLELGFPLRGKCSRNDYQMRQVGDCLILAKVRI